MKKYILIGLSAVLFTVSSDAQILKKLKRKVEQNTEKNASENAEREMQYSHQNMMPFSMQGEPVDESKIPAAYDFQWKYTANLSTREGNMIMAYRLKKNADYLGMEMPQTPNMFMVMDSGNELTALFFDANGNKMLMATRLNQTEQDQAQNDFYKDAEIRKIGTKNILGYNCQGYEVETKDHLLKFFLTNEADINFSNLYQPEKSKLPPGFKDEWFEDGKGLMLEMEMTDKKQPGNNVKMLCTGLKKEDFSIKKANYKSMYGN